jgi:hypothetical protein
MDGDPISIRSKGRKTKPKRAVVSSLREYLKGSLSAITNIKASTVPARRLLPFLIGRAECPTSRNTQDTRRSLENRVLCPS